jgi:hypothetical protein
LFTSNLNPNIDINVGVKVYELDTSKKNDLISLMANWKSIWFKSLSPIELNSD